MRNVGGGWQSGVPPGTILSAQVLENLLLGLWPSKKVTSESRGSVGNACEHAGEDGGELIEPCAQSSGKWLEESPSPKQS